MKPHDIARHDDNPDSPGDPETLGLPADVVAEIEAAQDDIKLQLTILLSHFMSDGNDLLYAAERTAVFLTEQGEHITAEEIIAIADITEETGVRMPAPALPPKPKASAESEPAMSTNLPRSEFFAQKPIRKDNTEVVGRNQPCPCGSGKKYKKCCGQPK